MLEDEDGPMLELLKTFHTRMIELPSRRAWRPDRERLAERFDRFRAVA
jgi:putative restriction endonuclease